MVWDIYIVILLVRGCLDDMNDFLNYYIFLDKCIKRIFLSERSY